MADIKAETIALAALFQACQQIQRVAYTGYMDDHAAACLLKALIVTDPQTVEDIYNPGQLLTGFKQLIESFGSSASDKTSQTIEITRNALKVISLEANIERNSKVYNRMGSEIDRLKEVMIQDNPDFMSAEPSTVLTPENLKEFSSIYQSLISPNFDKLIIYGEERFLRESENQEKIRSLLLAAIRAVVLWRQVGGRRRFLIFRRKAILACARKGAATGNLN